MQLTGKKVVASEEYKADDYTEVLGGESAVDQSSLQAVPDQRPHDNNCWSLQSVVKCRKVKVLTIASSADVIFSFRPQCKEHNRWLDVFQRQTSKDVRAIFKHLNHWMRTQFWTWESIYFVMKHILCSPPSFPPTIPPPRPLSSRMFMFANANKAPKINMQMWV